MPTSTKKVSKTKTSPASKGSGKKTPKNASSKTETETASLKSESSTVTVSSVDTTSAVTPMIEDESVEFTNQYQALSAIVTSMAAQFKEVTSQLKVLQKTHMKEVKALQKKTKRRKNRDGKAKSPSGFTQPTKISDELAGFLAATGASHAIWRQSIRKKSRDGCGCACASRQRSIGNDR